MTCQMYGDIQTTFEWLRYLNWINDKTNIKSKH